MIYAASGFFGDEVFKSTDGAATWFPINNGLVTLGNLDVRSLVMDTTDPQTLYLTGVTGLGSFKTNDGGANWTPMAGWGGFALAIDPFVPSTLYGSGPFASTFNFLKSTDSGGTWFLSNNGITDFFCTRSELILPTRRSSTLRRTTATLEQEPTSSRASTAGPTGRLRIPDLEAR